LGSNVGIGRNNRPFVKLADVHEFNKCGD